MNQRSHSAADSGEQTIGTVASKTFYAFTAVPFGVEVNKLKPCNIQQLLLIVGCFDKPPRFGSVGTSINKATYPVHGNGECCRNNASE
jgi:hypothetical protein